MKQWRRNYEHRIKRAKKQCSNRTRRWGLKEQKSSTEKNITQKVSHETSKKRIKRHKIESHIHKSTSKSKKSAWNTRSFTWNDKSKRKQRERYALLSLLLRPTLRAMRGSIKISWCFTWNRRENGQTASKSRVSNNLTPQYSPSCAQNGVKNGEISNVSHETII